MSTCYRCGRPILPTEFKLRRKVQTGERIHRRYPNPNVSAVQTNYGIRVVCSSCARSIDRDTIRREWLQWVELAIALIVLLTALVVRLVT